MKKFLTCIITTAFLMCIVSPLMSSSEDKTVQRRIMSDPSLVVPGCGAEGVMLGEEIGKVLHRFGMDKFRASRPPAHRELFKDVFDIDSSVKIVFDSLYLCEEKRMTLCVLNTRVVAVIGLNGDRTTVDGVDFKKGINAFIYHYGNRHLVKLQSGSNGIYLYRLLGIGAFDDGSNDSVDLFIVFSPDGNERQSP